MKLATEVPLEERQEAVVEAPQPLRLSDVCLFPTADASIEDPGPRIPKDSRLAWVTCFAAFFIQVFIVGVLHIFGVFFVAFIDEFQTSKANAAWIGSAAYGLTMAFGPLASACVGRWGVRLTIIVGSMMCVVALVASSFVTSMGWLFLSFSLIYGLGTSLAYSPTMTIADDYFVKYLSVATGITVSGSSVGTLVLSPTSQYLLDSLGWRGAMRVLAGFVALGMVCGMAFGPRPPAARTSAQRLQNTPVSRVVGELQLWKNKVYVVWVLGITLVMFGYYIPYVHLVSHALTLGIPTSKGSILMMTLGASTATGRIMFGKIITFGILDRLHMHQLSMVVTGVACMMLPLIKTFAGLVIYVILVGLVDGCFVVMMPLLTLTLAGVENKVLAWGYLVGVSSVTFTLGPPVAGWIYDATGSYNLAFQIAAVPILLGPAVLLFIPWAQRTGNTFNDALSVVGDVDTVVGSSRSSRSSGNTSMLSAWAAPPSNRGSLRGSAFSIQSTPRGHRKKRVVSPMDINSLQMAFMNELRDPQYPVSDGYFPGRLQSPDVSYATSLEGQQLQENKRHAKHPGRRFRSVSESNNDRGIQWWDKAGTTGSPPPMSIQSDPEHQMYMVPQSVNSSGTAEVEVCDSLLGIFLETSKQAPSHSSASPAVVVPALDRHREPVNVWPTSPPPASRTPTPPIPILKNHSNSSASTTGADNQDETFSVGSPPKHVHYTPSPPKQPDPLTDGPHNHMPNLSPNGSPSWSNPLLPIPEDQQLVETASRAVQEIIHSLEDVYDPSRNVESQATDSDTGRSLQKRTESDESVPTSSDSSSYSLHDPQTIFSIDVTEDNIEDRNKENDPP